MSLGFDFSDFFKEDRAKKEEEIFLYWHSTKRDIITFDVYMCRVSGKDYAEFLSEQASDFKNWLSKLSYQDLIELHNDCWSSSTSVSKSFKSDLDTGFSCFSSGRKEKINNVDLDGPEREKTKNYLLRLCSDLTGEEYHAHLLMAMYTITSMRDLETLVPMHFIHAEITDLRAIKQMMVMIKIATLPNLVSLLIKTLTPYDGPVLAMMAYKNDPECSLKVFPKDIMLKIAHEAAGTRKNE